MADPISISTMAAVSMGTTAAGGVLGAIGNVFKGDSTSAMYQYKAGIAMLNKTINTQNAAWAREAGDTQAEISGLKAGQNIASTKVSQAAGGADVNTGTPSQIRTDQGAAAEFDQNVIRWNAAKQEYGYKAKATMDQAEANLDIASADNAKTAGYLDALGSIIGSASSVASKWQQGKTIGIGT
jgi:hypothetical protein